MNALALIPAVAITPTRLNLGPEQQVAQPDDTGSKLLATGQAPVPAEQLATFVATFVDEYHSLNREITLASRSLCDEYSNLVNKSASMLKPMLVRMWNLLSQRGELRRRLRRGELPESEGDRLLAQINNLPRWTEWYENYRVATKGAQSLRSVQRDIAMLQKAGAEDTHATGERGGPDDQRGWAINNPGKEIPDNQWDRDEKLTPIEILGKFTVEMLKVLCGTSIGTDAMRIRRATQLVKDLQRAIAEGFFCDPARIDGTRL